MPNLRRGVPGGRAERGGRNMMRGRGHGRPAGIRWGLGLAACLLACAGIGGCGDDESTTPPQAPAVAVVSPNGGESLTAGETATIAWTATDGDTPANTLSIFIELSLDQGASWGVVAQNEANDGQYAWLVPLSPSTGGKIRVRASDGAQTGSDTSDGVFSIVPGVQPPSVQVLSPNGGESVAGGAEVTITWQALDPDTPSGNLVIDLEASLDNQATWSSIAQGEPNDGSYPWTAPLTSTTQAFIRVTASDGESSRSDVSDAAFNITYQPPPPPRRNIVSVGDGSAGPGAPAEVELRLENEDTISSLQLEVVYDPAAVSYVSGTATGPGQAFQLSLTPEEERVLIRFTPAGGSTFAPGDAAIARLIFQTIGAEGTSTTLTPLRIIALAPGGQSVSTRGEAGTISILDLPTAEELTAEG